jgi:fibronectin type 3 domain-containing protein
VKPHINLRHPRFAARIVRPTTTPISLAWDASASMNIAGYRIYYGPTSGDYTNTVNAGNVTNFTLTIPKGVVYIAATAYDTNGVESDFSNEITNGLPFKPNRVIMVWQTNTLIWCETNPTLAMRFWTGHNLSISITNF